jgi:hypothetical protein
MTAQAVPYNVTATGAVVATPCTYRGLSIRDASGATNTVTLYDNPSAASGIVLASFQLAANASALDSVPDGVRCAAGIYLQATGAIVGSVRVG